MVLQNPSTNTAIEGNPSTPTEITMMQEQRLDSILEQFGLSMTGGRAAKEKRLRQYIGLPPVAGSWISKWRWKWKRSQE